jgi:hypothetical protein
MNGALNAHTGANASVVHVRSPFALDHGGAVTDLCRYPRPSPGGLGRESLVDRWPLARNLTNHSEIRPGC